MFFALRDSIPRPFETEEEWQERRKERESLRVGQWRLESSVDHVRKGGGRGRGGPLSPIPEKGEGEGEEEEEGGGLFGVETADGERGAAASSPSAGATPKKLPSVLSADDLQKLFSSPKSIHRRIATDFEKEKGGRKRGERSLSERSETSEKGEEETESESAKLLRAGVINVMNILKGGRTFTLPFYLFFSPSPVRRRLFMSKE